MITVSVTRIIIFSVINALFLQLRTEIDVQQLRDAPEAYIQNVLYQQTAFLKSVMLISKWI